MIKPLHIILAFVFLVNIQSFSQKLSRHEKDSLKIALDEMHGQDQKHRWELSYGTNVQSEIDSINKLPIEDKKKVFREHHENNRHQIDSLSEIQFFIFFKATALFNFCFCVFYRQYFFQNSLFAHFE